MPKVAPFCKQPYLSPDFESGPFPYEPKTTQSSRGSSQVSVNSDQSRPESSKDFNESNAQIYKMPESTEDSFGRIRSIFRDPNCEELDLLTKLSDCHPDIPTIADQKLERLCNQIDTYYKANLLRLPTESSSKALLPTTNDFNSVMHYIESFRRRDTEGCRSGPTVAPSVE